MTDTGAIATAGRPVAVGARVTQPRSATAAAQLDLLALRLLQVGIGALPVVVVPQLHDRFVLSKLLLARGVALSGIALVALRWAVMRRVAWRRTALDLPVLGMLAAGVVSAVFAVNPTVALRGTYTRYDGLLTTLTCTALFFVTTQTCRDGDRARALLRALLAGGFVCAAIGVLQGVSGSVLGGGADGSETAFSFGGLARADGTTGNPGLLAVLMALLLPIAVGELRAARTRAARLAAANCCLVMTLALLLSFGRAAWLAVLVGVAVCVGRWSRHVLGWSAVVVGATVAMVALIAHLPTSLPLGQAIAARFTSLLSPTGGSGGTRVHIWSDAVHLFAARPLTGWGQDSVGLFYGTVQSGPWTPGFYVDKVHSQLLQTAVTEGVVGAVALTWLVIVACRSGWRARRLPGASMLAGALIAYLVAEQAEFDWVAVSVPATVILAAAAVTWSVDPRRRDPVLARSRTGRSAAAVRGGLVGVAIAAAVLLIPAVFRPAQANAAYLQALVATRADTALADVERARAADPGEADYALTAGILLERRGQPGDLALAAEAFSDACRLGLPGTRAWLALAAVDHRLGRDAEAASAAREAIRRGPFDPAAADVAATIAAPR